jgi:hypothetical protein
MPPPATDREALIAALAAQARSDAPAGPDLEPAELLDYLAGRLPPEEAERIERLLVASPTTARALLDLAELEAAGAGAGERPADIAALAGRRDFERRLPSAAPRPHRLPALLSGIAASLPVATLGLGSWGWRLQGELDRPIANLRSLELPSGSRAGTERVVELAPGAPLRLVLAPAERCPGYAAELKGPGSGDRRTIERLERDEQGRLVLLWRLEPGTYGLRLMGCEPRRELEVHRFRVTVEGG